MVRSHFISSLSLFLRYANTACELLTCDVSVINDKVSGDESLLNALYSFLEQDPPLNPLLASFFSKTFGSLISHNTEPVRKRIILVRGIIKELSL